MPAATALRAAVELAEADRLHASYVKAASVEEAVGAVQGPAAVLPPGVGVAHVYVHPPAARAPSPPQVHPSRVNALDAVETAARLLGPNQMLLAPKENVWVQEHLLLASRLVTLKSLKRLITRKPEDKAATGWTGLVMVQLVLVSGHFLMPHFYVRNVSSNCNATERLENCSTFPAIRKKLTNQKWPHLLSNLRLLQFSRWNKMRNLQILFACLYDIKSTDFKVVLIKENAWKAISTNLDRTSE